MVRARREGHLKIHAGQDSAQREILLPVMQVIRVEEVAGGPLLLAAVAALLWANLAPGTYNAIWATPISVSVAGLAWNHSLFFFINDFLLPLFFFVAGLELKRELVRGELSSLKAASLPVVMAIGGMAVPALAFLAVTSGTEAARGWGVPVATDIAFALALVAVLGKRIPNQVRIALLAFAALDDVGGVIVIAATYQADLSWSLLALALALLASVYVLQRLSVLPAFIPVLAGIGTFVAVMASGLHPTLAAIALGLTVPADPLISRQRYLERSRELTSELDDIRRRRVRAEEAERDPHEYLEQEDAVLGRLEGLTIATESMLDRLTRAFNPWVSYLALPLFALANGGVVLSTDTFGTAVSGVVFWGVLAGLIIGKPLGIVSLTWIAVRLRLVRLPSGMGWGDVLGLGLVAGIGFTVSLFIGELAFGGEARLESAKLGILSASLAAGALGAAVLLWVHRRD
jgi:NhaA family Na+:H+ antiporter